jgi:hypothetical protein
MFTYRYYISQVLPALWQREIFQVESIPLVNTGLCRCWPGSSAVRTTTPKRQGQLPRNSADGNSCYVALYSSL